MVANAAQAQRRQRRGRVGHDKAKIMRLIREMDIQEPIEQLLAQLTK